MDDKSSVIILGDLTYQSNTCPDVVCSGFQPLHAFSSFLSRFISRTKRFVLSVMPVCPSDYYSLRQWTVWFIAVDRTVCYSGLYSPLPQTVIISRLKELGWPGETAYSSLCLWYDIKIPKNNKWPDFFQNIMHTHFLTWSGISGNSLIAAIVKHIHIRKRDIKKEGYLSQTPNLH